MLRTTVTAYLSTGLYPAVRESDLFFLSCRIQAGISLIYYRLPTPSGPKLEKCGLQKFEEPNINKQSFLLNACSDLPKPTDVTLQGGMWWTYPSLAFGKSQLWKSYLLIQIITVWWHFPALWSFAVLYTSAFKMSLWSACGGKIN